MERLKDFKLITTVDDLVKYKEARLRDRANQRIVATDIEWQINQFLEAVIIDDLLIVKFL